jgi:hypothetical protein
MPSVEGVDDDSPSRGFGVFGRSDRSYGVRGYSNSIAVYGRSSNSYGVLGQSQNRPGVAGGSENAAGVAGSSYNGDGVYGESESESENAAGVAGRSNNRYGVRGESENNYGVYGRSNNRYGVVGESENAAGMAGRSDNRPGVVGLSNNSWGVRGYSNNSYGVAAYSATSYGLYASGEGGLAALLEGNVTITGNLQKAGGSFKIDHPLDPANKYLSHSFVESPDMKNVYDGVVTLDDKGEAEIELPDWFGALNKDFRYQLTAIGAPAPNLYIAEEISDASTTTTTNYSRTRSNKNKNNSSSRFKIAGGTSGMKVSWQVTGIRKDPWANAHRIPVEEDKPAKERGYYTYPELYMISQKREGDKPLALS